MMNNLYFEGDMKRLVFFFLMIFPALAFSQNRFPDYKSVLTKFFTLYHHENSATEMLNFARKRDGWYVQLLNPTSRDSVVSNQLFWSQQKGRYQVLENFVGAVDNNAGQKVISQT